MGLRLASQVGGFGDSRKKGSKVEKPRRRAEAILHGGNSIRRQEGWDTEPSRARWRTQSLA